MLTPGSVIGGRYRIERTLGRGATATVYAATQVALGRPVAVKVFDRIAGDGDGRALERFRREGRLQAELDHPAILPVLDAGVTGDMPYLVTKYVGGTTLAVSIRRGELPPARALALLAQVAEGLDHAHDRGLIHRDVKPSNVLVDEDGTAVLSDFGLARATMSATLTHTGGIVGTAAYVAPEVIRGKEATGASDRYSFAAMVFECLTGRVPFPSSTEVAALYAHTEIDAPRVSSVRPDLARADRALAAGLAKEPRRRPARALDLVRAVERSVGARTLAALPPPPTQVEDPAEAEPPRTGKRGRRRRRLVAAGATGISVVALVGILAQPEDGRVAVPRLPDGAIALGSELRSDDVETVDCEGEGPSRTSVACTISQLTLAGRPTVAPGDGTIIGWHVRGAVGRVQLQVIRQRPGGWHQAYRTTSYEVDGGLRSFTDEVTIRAGDLVALRLSPRSGVGIAAAAGDAASSARWIDPLALRPAAEARQATPTEGTPLDGEVQLRVDMVPDRRHTQPYYLNPAAARGMRPGETIQTRQIELGGAEHEIVLTRTGGINLLLRRGGETVAATFLPWFPAGGRLDDLTYVVAAEGPLLSIDWLDVRSRRVIHSEFLVSPEGFEQVS